MRKIIIIICYLNITIGFSQTDSIQNIITDKIKNVMDEVKKGRSNYYRELNTLLIENAELSYSIIRRYKNDGSNLVLREVIDNFRMLKGATKSKSLQQEITFDLLKIYKEKKSPLNNYNVFHILSSLSGPGRTKMSDFNDDSKKLLVHLLQDSLINKNLLKAVGIAGMKDQISELEKFLPEGDRYRKEDPAYFYFSWEWYARLSMARLGDKDQIDFCVKKITDSELEILSNSYAADDYFDYLVYIKQPEVFPFLFKMLLDNKKFTGVSIYTTSGFAISALQELLVGFPEKRLFSLTEKGVKFYKKWVRKNKGKYKFIN